MYFLRISTDVSQFINLDFSGYTIAELFKVVGFESSRVICSDYISFNLNIVLVKSDERVD